MRALAVFATLVLAALGSGCSVQALEDTSFDPTKNRCSADSECGDGTCDQELGLCRASQGQFAKVLFEVTPPSNVDHYGGLSFLVPEELASGGGDFDLALGVVSKVTGTVQANQQAYPGACSTTYGAANADATPQVELTFTSTTNILGLPAQQYSAKTQYNDKTGEFDFELWLPADEYDVYVQPPADATTINPGCTVVPQLRRHIQVASGDVALAIPLQTPKLLSLEVVVPGLNAVDKKPLVGWSVAVLDPTTGKVLSTPVELAYTQDPNDTQNQHYFASIEYSEAIDSPAGIGKELVRISPPEGDDKPTLVLERAALELFTPGSAKIEAQKQLWPEPVQLDQISLFGSDGEPFTKTAAARFVSTKLELTNSGTQSGLAFFEKTVQIADGIATKVQLLPGEYDVYVAPPAGSGFATTKTKLTVGAKMSDQGGKSVTLELESDVGGSVLTPGGAKAAAGAAVQAVASPATASPLAIAVGAVPFIPKATSGLVEASGQFSLEADPGTFDFSIRPSEGTGFAWLVRPNVEVQSGVHDLGSMLLPLPVVYSGLVTVPGAESNLPVPGSLIRAFVYLNDSGYTEDRAGAKAVVQVAEGRADETGKFRLFLPAHLN